MRRSVLPASLLLASGLALSGCGFPSFLSDSHGLHWDPNRPIGDGENMRRVKGIEPNVPPLLPEPGNVWPGPAAPEPTLQDLEKQQNDMSGTAPGAVATPFTPDHQQPRPVLPSNGNPANGSPGNGSGPPGPPPASPRSTVPGTGPQGQIAPTPRGPAVNTRGTGGSGGTSSTSNGSIVVPNGNGTSTVIAPDGSISTIPTPK